MTAAVKCTTCQQHFAGVRRRRWNDTGSRTSPPALDVPRGPFATPVWAVCLFRAEPLETSERQFRHLAKNRSAFQRPL